MGNGVFSSAMFTTKIRIGNQDFSIHERSLLFSFFPLLSYACLELGNVVQSMGSLRGPNDTTDDNEQNPNSFKRYCAV